MCLNQQRTRLGLGLLALVTSVGRSATRPLATPNSMDMCTVPMNQDRDNIRNGRTIIPPQWKEARVHNYRTPTLNLSPETL